MSNYVIRHPNKPLFLGRSTLAAELDWVEGHRAYCYDDPKVAAALAERFGGIPTDRRVMWEGIPF